MGLREVKADAENVLLCGGADESACVCLEPLPCAAAGTCANYDENLAILREALAKPVDVVSDPLTYGLSMGLTPT
jgi:hypothetical protein